MLHFSIIILLLRRRRLQGSRQLQTVQYFSDYWRALRLPNQTLVRLVTSSLSSKVLRNSRVHRVSREMHDTNSRQEEKNI
ncbi:hypothetical protein JG687_00012190 [Phytophthora cactorum]|uniref:Secreted protein n=1 Tax=Phytophthora cactorum TaxID=29920 RepID=A0A329RU11_9STRA|nr:hypothetical protein Pcac1_g14003 [Phytophthora cactorum]KAG2807792.1 hypothetical protein PC111_g16777 [Phytophthora cactorum]KAG2813593.1 hypothetical protein PC112_g14674 [Phytophthora cactorum]KAG2852238.1 hypothetical protein PC113_g15198 [Phytophthora cactorum]KAG2892617.1 hypothetical protein PC114_g16572 [Phytophthora cactorum]